MAGKWRRNRDFSRDGVKEDQRLSSAKPATNLQESKPQQTPEASVAIESVRTSHLMLVGVCFAMLAATAFEVKSDADRALAELRKVKSMLTVWEEEPDWLDSELHRRFAKYELSRRAKTETSPFLLEAKGRGWKLITTSKEQEKVFSGTTVGTPETLAEFRDIWTAIKEPLAVIAVTEMGSDVDVVYRISSIHYAGPTTRTTESIVDVNSGTASASNKLTPIEFVIDSLHWSEPEGSSDELGTNYKLTGGVEAELAPEDAPAGDETAGWTVEWPVTVDREPVNIQSIINRRFGYSWRKGNFADTFSDLQQITEHYQELPFDQIDRIVSGEARRTAEKIDILGLKMSAELIRRWGIWVILAVSLFYLIHLTAFIDELKSGKTVRMASWMGLYSSTFSRLVVLGTVTALPLFTSGLFVFRSLSSEAGNDIPWLALAGCCLLVVCTIVSALRLVSVWRSHVLQ